MTGWVKITGSKEVSKGGRKEGLLVGSVRQAKSGQARPPSPPLTESAATSDHWFNTTQYYQQSGTNKVPLN